VHDGRQSPPMTEPRCALARSSTQLQRGRAQRAAEQADPPAMTHPQWREMVTQ
jgi:hypothetical protein